jgi:hypothetical protein
MKKNNTLLKGLVTIALLILASEMFAAASDKAVEIARSFERFDESQEYFGFLQENCMDCHNFEDWAGSLAFDVMTAEEIADNVETWEKVVLKLRGRLMPPAGADRPDNAHTDDFVAWLENYLDHAGATERHVGHIGIHRINRKEYGNSVRGLLGIEVDASSLLPQDDSIEGFDNVAEALRVSPVFLEQSLNSARIVAQQAIGNPNARTGGSTYRAGGNQYIHREGLPLGSRGGVAVEHNFVADGEYVLNIGNLASRMWEFNQEFTHTVVATYDGERIFEMEIGGGDDLKAIDQIGDVAVDAINSKLKNIPFIAEAGPHTVAVFFVHRSFAEYEGRLHRMTPSAVGENVISLNSIEIQGPFNPTGLSPTPARNKIFTCYPEGFSEVNACASQILSQVARNAFRGQVTVTDINRLMAVFEDGNLNGGFDIGIRRALTAIIASPKFLYRIEQLPNDAEPGAAYALNEYELASRLAFFLWSSIPDEQLLDLADAGELSRPEVLKEQVTRMLQDPQAETLASNFAYQWLNMGGLDEIDPDPVIFRDIDFGIRELFKREVEMLANDIFLNNKNVTEMLSADYTYMNERLALHYGDQTVKGDAFRKVPVKNPDRYGLLGKGAILMVSAYPDRTSPVLRGAYVMEHLTGTPPPLPPPNVEALQENRVGELPKTVRARLEAHRDNPSCAACHGIIDPLGFALEGFDAVGRERTRDRMVGTDIDTYGVLPDGTEIGGVEDLRSALLERPTLFVQNLVEKLMLYALGRPIEPADMPAVRDVVRLAQASDFQFYAIVQGIVNADQFLFKQAPELPETAEATGLAVN